VSFVTKTPLSSSRYDVFDEDIPFYQIVLHGSVAYSTAPINANARAAELLLRGIAAGASPHFDMHAAEAEELKDSLYDRLFYAAHSYWAEDAAGCARFAADILNDVSGSYITDYKNVNENIIETRYGNGVTVTVDLKELTVRRDGELFRLADYVGKGFTG
jgi:hypothetical protein